MEKEVLIYGSIYSQSAKEFIQEVNSLAESDDLTVRVSTDGGSPEYGWGMVAKFAEFKGKKKAKADGKAYSTGAFFFAYTEDTEALDVSQFLIHRAAYPEWLEKSEYFTDDLKKNLANINGSLRAALAARIDEEKFTKITGKTLDDVFSMESSVDVFLTAQEAKKIGLVKKIIQLTPDKMAELDAQIAAKWDGYEPVAAQTQIKNKQENSIKMTKEQLKAEHPNVYAEIFALGAAKQKEDVEAWLEFIDVDAEAVAKGIKEGKEVTSKVVAEFGKKMFSKTALASLESGSAGSVVTAEAPNTVPSTQTEEESIWAKAKEGAVAEFKAIK